MTHSIHNRIREIIDRTPGLTQRGLAERMGLNPAAVNRMLYGRRNIRVDEIPVIESYLGEALDLHGDFVQKPQVMRRGFSDVPQQKEISRDESCTDMVPVMGDAPDNVLDWAPRHPLLFGIENGFAFYIPDDKMAPRYFRGELVYIHPGRPVAVGKDCFIRPALQNGAVRPAFVRRLVHIDDDTVGVATYAGDGTTTLSRSDILGIYCIIARG